MAEEENIKDDADSVDIMIDSMMINISDKKGSVIDIPPVKEDNDISMIEKNVKRRLQ